MSRGLRFRVFLRGAMVLEEWADCIMGADAVMEMAQRHVLAATQTSGPWLVEVYDPDLPDREAYLRFGTDLDGMRAPTPADSAAAKAHPWAADLPQAFFGSEP